MASLQPTISFMTSIPPENSLMLRTFNLIYLFVCRRVHQ